MISERDIFLDKHRIGPAYTNEEGLTLYTFDCSVRAPDTADLGGAANICRNWSEDTSDHEQFCATPDHYAEMWQPLRAPDDSQPRGSAWSVAVIPDPKYPLRWVIPGELQPFDSSSGAIKVWMFKGQPLYASTGCPTRRYRGACNTPEHRSVLESRARRRFRKLAARAIPMNAHSLSIDGKRLRGAKAVPSAGWHLFSNLAGGCTDFFGIEFLGRRHRGQR